MSCDFPLEVKEKMRTTANPEKLTSTQRLVDKDMTLCGHLDFFDMSKAHPEKLISASAP